MSQKACCGAPPPFNGLTYCGGNYTYPNGTVVGSSLCEDRNDYLFFDAIHPTKVGHRQFANLLWNGNTLQVDPLNIKELMAYMW